MSGYGVMHPGLPEEQARLNLQHQIWVLTYGGRLHASELSEPPESILDIGCGTGIWAVMMAHKYPSAKVVAMDVTPPQIKDIPPNLTIVKADAHDPWPFQNQTFSFIHGRALTGAIHDWPAFLEKCKDILIPGGILELADAILPFRSANEHYDNQSSPFIRFCMSIERSWIQRGMKRRDWEINDSRLEQLGLVDVKKMLFRWPVGAWPTDEHEHEIGRLQLKNMQSVLETDPRKLVEKDPQLDEQGIGKLIEETREDLRDGCEAKKYYMNLQVITARKPKN